MKNTEVRRCKKCNSEYKHYGSSLTKCPCLANSPKPLLQKKREAIKRISDKKKDVRAQLAKLKQEKIDRLGNVCECCGRTVAITYSHNIPVSIRPDLELDPNNAHLGCLLCHFRWEHLLEPREVLKFENLQTILDYIKANDTGRYMHVCGKLRLEY